MQLLSPLQVSRDSGAGACAKTCPPCIAVRLERAEALHSPSLFGVHGSWFAGIYMKRELSLNLSGNEGYYTNS